MAAVKQVMAMKDGGKGDNPDRGVGRSQQVAVIAVIARLACGAEYNYVTNKGHQKRSISKKVYVQR
jgi:hypothetical protein